MKLTELPRCCEPNYQMMKRIKEDNKICPCCGEDRTFGFENGKMYGVFLGGFPCKEIKRQKPWYKHIFSKPKTWWHLEFECYTCGARWESEEYPYIEYKLD